MNVQRGAARNNRSRTNLQPMRARSQSGAEPWLVRVRYRLRYTIRELHDVLDVLDSDLSIELELVLEPVPKPEAEQLGASPTCCAVPADLQVSCTGPRLDELARFLKQDSAPDGSTCFSPSLE